MPSIIGHQQIIEYFKQVMDNQSLAHCYTFSGPSNVGKTAVLSQIVSRIFNNQQLTIDLEQPEQLAQRCPDFYYLSLDEEKSEINVEQARQLKQDLSLGSFLGKYKVAVIYDAHKMNQTASNAILKLLEEPAKDTIIFLLTENSEALLPTIVSRSVKINFSLVPLKTIEAGLIGLGADNEKAQLIARLACGRAGKAIEYLNDSDKFATIKAQAEAFIQILQKPRFEQFSFLQSALKSQEDEQLSLWQLVLRDILLLQSNHNDNLTFPEHINLLEALSKKIEPSSVVSLLEEIQKLPSAMKFHINKTTYLENSFLHL